MNKSCQRSLVDCGVKARGGGGALSIYTGGVCRGISKQGVLRPGHNPKKGGSWARAQPKKGGLRHEHESKKWGLKNWSCKQVNLGN